MRNTTGRENGQHAAQESTRNARRGPGLYTDNALNVRLCSEHQLAPTQPSIPVSGIVCIVSSEKNGGSLGRGLR